MLACMSTSTPSTGAGAGWGDGRRTSLMAWKACIAGSRGMWYTMRVQRSKKSCPWYASRFRRQRCPARSAQSHQPIADPSTVAAATGGDWRLAIAMTCHERGVHQISASTARRTECLSHSLDAIPRPQSH